MRASLLLWPNNNNAISVFIPTGSVEMARSYLGAMQETKELIFHVFAKHEDWAPLEQSIAWYDLIPLIGFHAFEYDCVARCVHDRVYQGEQSNTGFESTG